MKEHSLNFLQQLRKGCTSFFERIETEGFPKLQEILVSEGGSGPAILPSQEERKFIPFIQSTMDIDRALLRLRTVAKFLREVDSRPADLSPVEYLEYHVDSFFQSVYLLRNRLSPFLKRTERAYKGTAVHSALVTWSESNLANLDDVTSGIVEIRGAHVHETDYVDKNIALLRLGDSLLTANRSAGLLTLPERFARELDSMARASAARKSEMLAKFSEAMDAWVERMFKELLEIVVDANGDLIPPLKQAG